jgi:ABC-type transport system involved in multi-copper enzyme maturation permease subunit
MLWVTWRQHRGLLACTLIVFAAGVAGMLAAGLKIYRDHALLGTCHAPVISGECLPYNSLDTDWLIVNGIRVGLLAAPALLAMFAGAPVVARELERGTFRYAWTQGIGRVRWTVAKLAIVGSLVTIAALVLSQLLTWLFVPFLTIEEVNVVSPEVFGMRGVAYAAWTLTAFCLGAFLGTLIGRVLPAMAASLGCFAALVAVTVFYLHSRYPVRTFWPMQFVESGWLLALSAVLVAGTVRLVRRHAA